jgi:hypothetical protein
MKRGKNDKGNVSKQLYFFNKKSEDRNGWYICTLFAIRATALSTPVSRSCKYIKKSIQFNNVFMQSSDEMLHKNPNGCARN